MITLCTPPQNPEELPDIDEQEVRDAAAEILANPTPGQRETILDCLIDSDKIMDLVFHTVANPLGTSRTSIYYAGIEIVEKLVADGILTSDRDDDGEHYS